MPFVFSIKDSYRQAVEAATGGKCTVMYDDQGYPSIMVLFPTRPGPGALRQFRYCQELLLCQRAGLAPHDKCGMGCHCSLVPQGRTYASWKYSKRRFV